MSIKDRLQKHLLKNRVVALTVRENREATWQFHLILFEKTPDGEITLHEEEDFDSVGQLEAWLKEKGIKDLPFVVAIDTPEILLRKVQEDVPTEVNLLKRVIPQADANTFFIQAFPEKIDYFVCVVRNHVIQNVLTLLPESLSVIDVLLAPICLAQLAKGIEQPEVGLGYWQVSKENGQVISMVRVDDTSIPSLSFEEEGMNPENITSYASAIHFWNRPEIISAYKHRSSLEEFLHRRFLTKYAPVVIGAFFAILLLNTLVFLHFNDSNQELRQQNVGIRSVNDRINNYSNFIAENRQLLTGNEAYFTRIVDDVGQSVPTGISLLQLEIIPLELSSKKIVEPERVIIMGESIREEDYTNWIEQLIEMSWTQEILKNDYRLNVNSGVGAFDIEIKIKEDVE